MVANAWSPYVPWATVAITWWRHQMETCAAFLALCAGNSPVPVNSPHKGQWRGALMFSLICAWIYDWVNNREAGDWDAIVVIMTSMKWSHQFRVTGCLSYSRQNLRRQHYWEIMCNDSLFVFFSLEFSMKRMVQQYSLCCNNVAGYDLQPQKLIITHIHKTIR